MDAQVTLLVDADNLTAARLAALMDAAQVLPVDARRLVVAGSAAALERATWPPDAYVVESRGWQRADAVLAAEYDHAPGPLVIASGDGDFGLLAQRHDGPVLVVSGAASAAYRTPGIRVIDPVREGTQAIRAWLMSALSESGGFD